MFFKELEENFSKEIEKKDEELSRVQEELSQELERAKQPDSLPTDVKVSIHKVHMTMFHT